MGFLPCWLRVYPHRYIANQLQSQLYEQNRALEYTISFLSLTQQQFRTEVTQTISTAQSPGR